MQIGKNVLLRNGDKVMEKTGGKRDTIHKEQNWKDEIWSRIEKQGIGKRDIVMI